MLIVMAMDLTEGYTQEEIEAELAEDNFDSMLEVAEEALKQQGYTIEKTEVIHDIHVPSFPMRTLTELYLWIKVIL